MRFAPFFVPRQDEWREGAVGHVLSPISGPSGGRLRFAAFVPDPWPERRETAFCPVLALLRE